MSKLEWIEAEVRQLPREQARELQDWLADYLETQAELSPDFVASIGRGETDLQEGRVRVHQPPAAGLFGRPNTACEAACWVDPGD
ncbi:MAG: hypothetical protein HS113_29040 [Verrucomicrobiales bacterium]|nr:hypothetical protein [Verrucomicrobiales bacterium]